ncbi:hypothetical protein OG738_19130 [Amycolatopsis sp. NBC_01488]|uniref:hypothetical protein n=1 Tax=Amycolatopsis sp. NBC_01488 TaxID=2903563 RepID=UPI002E2B302D|nr:hypothetical protein [Amycolatopsis sp. NBC_01488]
MRLPRPIRYALAGLLAAAPVVIAVVSGTLQPTRQVVLPPLTPYSTAQDAAIAAGASLSRVADVTVTFRTSLRGIEAHTDYVITVPRTDPLVAAVGSGVVGGAALAHMVAGGPADGTYAAPVVEYGPTGLNARLLVSSRPVQVRAQVLVEKSDHDRTGQVALRTLNVRADGVAITQVRSGGDEPTMVNRQALTFTGRVQDALYVSVGVDPSAAEASEATNVLSLTRGPVLWHVAMAVPWLILLVAGARSEHPLRRPLRRGAALYLTAVPVLASVLLWTQQSAAVPDVRRALRDVVLALVVVVAPVLTAGWCRWTTGKPAFAGGLRRYLPVLAVVLTAAGIAVARPTWYGALPMLGGAVVAGLLLAPAARLVRRRDLDVLAALLGFSLVPGAVVLDFLFEQAQLDYGTVAALGIGLLLTPVPVALVPLLFPRHRKLGYAGAVVLGVLLIAPLVTLLRDPPRGLMSVPALGQPMSIGVGAATVLLLTLLVLLIVQLYRLSADPGLYAEPLTRAAGIAVAVIAAIPAYLTLLGPAVAALSLVVTLQWLVPRSRTAPGMRLAGISVAEHRDLVRSVLWQRFVDRIGVAIVRAAPERAAKEATSSASLRAVWDETVGRSPSPPEVSPGTEAFGSGGGFSPRRNLLFGAAAAAVLALPVMTYEGWLIFFGADVELGRMTTATQVQQLVRLLRWVAYGGLFGLFYPVVRGDRPTVKAGFLLLALLPSELLAMATAPYSPAQTVWVALAIRTGQVTVLSIGLGLLWERRLALAAGLQWGHVRDFRSFASLITPVTTIAVAAATTIATAVAGAAVGVLLKPTPADSTTPPGGGAPTSAVHEPP